MEPRERNRLRALQDRFLASHKVKHFVESNGENAPVSIQGSPTFAQVKTMLFPSWEGFFKQILGE